MSEYKLDDFEKDNKTVRSLLPESSDAYERIISSYRELREEHDMSIKPVKVVKRPCQTCGAIFECRSDVVYTWERKFCENCRVAEKEKEEEELKVRKAKYDAERKRLGLD